MQSNLDISIVVPLLNEEESLPELCSWIHRVMMEHKFSYELILIDDGSYDDSWKIVGQLAEEFEAIKGIRFNRNYGKSAALHVGFRDVKGDVVVTMDADLQDSPEEIPEMYNMIMKQGLHIVSGWKKERHDSFIKNNTSKIYNGATRMMSGIKLHDFNCGLKAYRKEVVQSIEIYGEMHRYIPVIAKWNGFGKIGEKVVKHQARKYGSTKFGLSRFIRGPLDLLSIMFVSKFKKRPMHFFGVWGSLFFLTGMAISLFLIIEKIIAIYWTDSHYRDVVDQPLFFIALAAIIIGSQTFLAGFLGEMISLNDPKRNDYVVRQRL